MAQSSNSSLLLDIAPVRNLEKPKVAIIATEWNDAIIAAQVAGAKKIARETDAVITAEMYVPGCFELPFAVKMLYDRSFQANHAPEAIIVFGAVIRGGTPHFDYVCKAVTEGITHLNLSLPVPVIFGVLTLDNEAQAWERLGGAHGHKGEEAMITALKMIRLKRSYLK